MLVHPNIDPVALHLGPVEIHWYGLMYLVGFLGCWRLGVVRAAKPHVRWPSERVADLLSYVVAGVLLGGRLGYIIFYAYSPDGRWLERSDPLMIFRVWDGGMSFHGGLLGVIIAMCVFARRQKLSFWDVSDFTAILTPFGLFTGRIGNFINGELWGRPTGLPWGMIFQTAPDLRPRHPSQLYEAVLEGLVLLVVLWLFSSKARPRMATSGLFLLLYGAFRFAVEFVRMPDPQFGYLAWGWLTMGQILCLPMLGCGALLLVLAYRTKTPVF